MKHYSSILLALVGSLLFTPPVPATARISYVHHGSVMLHAAGPSVRARPIPATSEMLIATLTNDGPTLLGNATHLTVTLTSSPTLGQWRWITTTVDKSGSVGEYTSLAIGTDGLPVISYSDFSNTALKVSHCQTASCTSVVSATVDNSGSVGIYTSLAIGLDGLPIISYYDVINKALKVAQCQTVSCTSVVSTTVDNSTFVGLGTSLAIGLDGLPVISYFDNNNTALKVAQCQTVSCTSVISITVDGSGSVDRYTSLAIGTDGLPIISYYDFNNTALKVAHCQTVSCTSVVSTTVDNSGSVGEYTSLAIGTDGLPVIGYLESINGDLKVAQCQTASCTSVVSATVDNSGIYVGSNTSLAIGTDGLPIISYYDIINGALKVAQCQTVSCTSVVSTTVDSSSFVGWYTSLAIGTDGLPVISYHDLTNSALKVAKALPTTVTYTLDYGDGTALVTSAWDTGMLPFTHTYTVPGSYTAILTATDGLSSTSASSVVSIVANYGLLGALTSDFQGRFVTYTLVVTNTSANLPASNVILSGSVPGNARLVSAETALKFMTGGDYGTGYVQSPTPLTLLSGQSVQLSWVVEVMALAGDIVTQGHAVSDSAVIQVIATAHIYRIYMPVIRKNVILIE